MRADADAPAFARISAPVNSGAKQLIVPGATWRPGQQLLISDALNSTDYHAEVATVAVAKKAAAGRVALAVGLKHAYNAGASVLLLSRSISVTSEQYADGGASIKIAPPAPWAVQVMRTGCLVPITVMR